MNNYLKNILIAPNVITEEGIQYILNHAKTAEKRNLAIFDPSASNETKSIKFSVDKDMRDTWGVDINEIFDDIVELYKNIIFNIINPFYNFEIKDSEVPQLLYYTKGGHYVPHIDGRAQWKAPTGEIIWKKSVDRDLSTIIFLNDDFEGGDLVFPDLKIRIRPEPGLLVCFPSDQNYVHGVDIVTSGERYSLVNWMTVKGFQTLEEGNIELSKKYGIQVK